METLAAHQNNLLWFIILFNVFPFKCSCFQNKTNIYVFLFIFCFFKKKSFFSYFYVFHKTLNINKKKEKDKLSHINTLFGEIRGFPYF